MMNGKMIKAEGLSKAYRIGPFDGKELLRSVFGRRRNPRHWALKNVSFELSEGDVLGVVGKNGAGKSTLLKILSQITSPTAGSACLRGRVAALLEIGTGFHPELTGRENIFLNGGILGLSRSQIKRHFDAIVSFAELEAFLDTPVKRYSTGMALRLGFAVAAHLEPEILLVDEVLAVGDFAFQQKCLGKTREFARAGRTVVFVSHNLGAVVNLCNKALLLDKGEVVEMGDAAQVVQTYYRRNIAQQAEYHQAADPSKDVHLRRVAIVDRAGQCRSDIGYHEPFRFVLEYEINRPVSGLSVGIGVGTVERVPVFVSADFDAHPDRLGPRRPGRYRTSVEIPGKWLNIGSYGVQIFVANGAAGEAYDRVEALNFVITDTGCPGSQHGVGYRKGLLQPVLDWDLDRIDL